MTYWPPRREATIKGTSLYRNSAVIMACKVVTAGTSLLAVPFVVSSIGLEGYGTWETFFAIASLSTMLQQAMAGTLLWKVSHSFGANDIPAIHRSVRLGVSSIGVFLLILVPIAWLLSHVIVGRLGLNPKLLQQAIWVLPTLVTVCIAAGVNDLLGSVLSGHQRIGNYTIIQAIGLIFNYSIAIFGVRHGGGLESLLIGTIAEYTIDHILLRILAGRLCPGLSLLPQIPTKAEVRELGRYWALMMAGFGAQALRDQTDKLVLISFASPAWVAYYGIAARLSGVVLETSRFFHKPLTAAVGHAYGEGNWPAIEGFYRRTTIILACFSGAVTVFVVGLHERLIYLWMGHRIQESELILAILVVGNACSVLLAGPATAVCRGVNKVYIETNYVLVNLVSNLVLTIVLVMTIGPIGTVVASGATWAVSSIIFSFLIPKMLDLQQDGTWIARKASLLVAALAIGLSLVSHHLHEPASRGQALISIIGLGAIGVPGYLLLLVLLNIVPRDTIKRIQGKLTQRLARAGT